MSSAVDRLKSLFSELGLNVEDGITAAEIESYVCEIEKIRENFTKDINKILIKSNNIENLKEYIELLGKCIVDGPIIDSYLTMCRFGSWGCFSGDEFKQCLHKNNYSTSYQINKDKKTMLFVNFSKDIEMLGEFLNSYVPLNLDPIIAQDSSQFDNWDAWGKMWFKLDKMGLPFSIIDFMEVEKYE